MYATPPERACTRPNVSLRVQRYKNYLKCANLFKKITDKQQKR